MKKIVRNQLKEEKYTTKKEQYKKITEKFKCPTILDYMRNNKHEKIHWW